MIARMNNAKMNIHGNPRTASPAVLGTILEELRMLRNEMQLFLPQEDLAGYAHPERIKRSYQKAQKQYPRASS